MGRGVYTLKKCKYGEPKHNFVANPHQTKVTDYFLRSNEKGILLYHKLGSGKTCTSIMIADKFLNRNIVDMVYVLTPGSLRENWIFEYCKTCGFSADFLKKFTFITYNYDVQSQVRKLDFNRSLVIIDEVHNLINGVKNVSKNAFTMYTKIMDSDCRVVALSGTPVFSNECEWSLLGNLLRPGGFDTIFKGATTDRSLWDSCRVTDRDLQGIVSYYPGNPEFYPDVIYQKPIMCKMGELQYAEFVGVAEWENNTRIWGPPPYSLLKKNPSDYWKKHTQYMIANKWILSRRTANFFYPMDEMVSLIPEATPDSIDKDMMSEGMSSLKPDMYYPTGWLEPKYLDNARLATVYSPKITALLVNIISRIDTKHAVYTFFKTRGGVTIIHTLLNKCGIKAAVYSGDMNDRERTAVLKKYNSLENRNGDSIKVLLITDAGAEGITLLEVNNFHILESSTRENKIRQAIGRAVRYKSHSNMPKDRQYVNVWRYWSVSPEGLAYDAQASIYTSGDMYLYQKGMRDVEVLDEFNERLARNSIENV
jgi:superfamily II DNA or RNA helicase